jgi:hypothetical protein
MNENTDNIFKALIFENTNTLKFLTSNNRKQIRYRDSFNSSSRRIFGPKRDEVTGEWRKLHNEELRDLYSSPGII